MIVKTGANYQAEGGYIEASKTGPDVTITIDGDNYNFKSDAVSISSLYKITISTAPELTNPISGSGLILRGATFVPSGFNLTNTPTEKYASENIGVFFATGGATGVTNPGLAEGSRNASIKPYSEAGYLILANGPDAVAIIKEVE